MSPAHPPSLTSLRPTAARRWWAALAVMALLWAQGLGVWHHTAHAPGLAGSTGASGPVGQAHALALGAALPGAAATTAESTLHHAPGSVECRLLDLLLLADGAAPPMAAAVLPALAAALVPCPPAALRALPAAPPYQARAPPG